jgi:hypothetical protein
MYRPRPHVSSFAIDSVGRARTEVQLRRCTAFGVPKSPARGGGRPLVRGCEPTGLWWARGGHQHASDMGPVANGADCAGCLTCRNRGDRSRLIPADTGPAWLMIPGSRVRAPPAPLQAFHPRKPPTREDGTENTGEEPAHRSYSGASSPHAAGHHASRAGHGNEQRDGRRSTASMGSGRKSRSRSLGDGFMSRWIEARRILVSIVVITSTSCWSSGLWLSSHAVVRTPGRPDEHGRVNADLRSEAQTPQQIGPPRRGTDQPGKRTPVRVPFTPFRRRRSPLPERSPA